MPENKLGVGPKGGSANFKLQGHTASAYGTDPSVQAKGAAGAPPRDLKA